MGSQNGLEGTSKVIEFQTPNKKPTKQTKENLLVEFTVISALLGFIPMQGNLMMNPDNE